MPLYPNCQPTNFRWKWAVILTWSLIGSMILSNCLTFLAPLFKKIFKPRSLCLPEGWGMRRWWYECMPHFSQLKAPPLLSVLHIGLLCQTSFEGTISLLKKKIKLLVNLISQVLSSSFFLEGCWSAQQLLVIFSFGRESRCGLRHRII